MENILSQLKQIPLFAEVPEHQLLFIAQKGELRTFQAGDTLFKKGDAIENMNIILKGRMAVKFEQNGQFRDFSEFKTFDITGALPYSRAKVSAGLGVFKEESEILSLSRTYFKEMICEHHELTEKFVHLMADRVRDMTKTQQQNEKMMALGKISAGLAHELNNPASAVIRSASSLRKHLGNVPDKFKRVIAIRMNNMQVDTVNDILFTQLNKGINESISLMERTNLEDEIIDWLEERQVEDAFDIAPNLVDFHLKLDDLEKICAQIPDKKDFAPVIQWIDNILTTEKLVLEIEEASKRIADLVNSVKVYSHMDQSPEKQWTDIHLGIRNTLKILNHKLKKNKVEFKANFQENLPQIKAFVGELNQVWTNLIDNALDAMENGGILEIATKENCGNVEIAIIDSGVGISQEVLPMIFDPFFTTKDIGKGTGLGLDVVRKIVADHNAQIKVESEVGKTVFTLSIPIGN